MSSKDKKQKSAETGKPHKVGMATFLGVLPDDHPIYQSGTRVSFRSRPRPRPAPETGEATKNAANKPYREE